MPQEARMYGLAILGFILVLVAVAWFLDRRRPASPRNTRWDDPGQSEAFAAVMLSKLRRGGTGRS
jgi:hypothetical protein